MRRSWNVTSCRATTSSAPSRPARPTGEPLPAALLRDGLVGSKDLTAALALSLGVRFIDFQDTPLHQDAPTLVPAEVARAHHALAVDFEGTKLVVAFAEPADDEALSAVGAATGYEIIPAVADRAELMHAIDQVYGSATTAAAVRDATCSASCTARSCTSTSCSTRSSTGAAPTCTSPRARTRSCGCTARCGRSPTSRCSTARRSARWCTRSSRRSSGRSSRTSSSSTRATRCRARAASV